MRNFWAAPPAWGYVIYIYIYNMGMGQNPIPLVNIKIAGKWMFIPLKMILIGIDPYPYGCFKKYINIVNALNFFTFSVTTIPIPVFLIRFPGSFLDGEV